MLNHNSSDNPIVLRAEGLSKSYDGTQALHDLSFTVRAGEILGLLGPNGAGKTTAIRILTTILRPDSGSFSVLGIPGSRPEEIRALIGVLPESNGFPPGLTGIEYLTYMGRLYGQPTVTAQAKGADLLHLFGLTAASHNRVNTYSRGMKQRLAIARALINDPKLLFLDEPTLGFDPKGQREMLRAIQRAAEEGQVAIVLSSHQLEVVEALGDSVLILNQGRVIASGSVAEIKRKVTFPMGCRLQMPAEAIPHAIELLSTVPGASIERHNHQKDELRVLINGQANGHDMGSVLQLLLNAGIPVDTFSRDTHSLSDAFLKMIEDGALAEG